MRRYRLFKAKLSHFFYRICAILLLSTAVCTSCTSVEYSIYSSLIGVLSDEQTGEAVSNAIITLSPSNQTAKSSETGEFVFEDIDAGQYTISVQKTGYYTNRKTITLNSGVQTEIHIQMKSINQ